MPATGQIDYFIALMPVVLICVSGVEFKVAPFSTDDND